MHPLCDLFRGNETLWLVLEHCSSLYIQISKYENSNYIVHVYDHIRPMCNIKVNFSIISQQVLIFAYAVYLFRFISYTNFVCNFFSLQKASRCLLLVYPLLHHYVNLQERLALNLAISNRTFCKLLSVLLSIFSSLVAKVNECV